MPNTAVNMNETRKKRVKNGMRTMIKTERKMKSNGSRMYQPNESIKKLEGPTPLPKISTSCFPTKLLTIDVSQ
jgi:hypothetical protein